MIDFSALRSITIPEGNVVQIACNGVVLWGGGGGTPDAPSYTNLVRKAVANDGSTIYGTGGYTDGKYLSSNGAYGNDAAFVSTGNIKMTWNSPIYIKGNALTAVSHTRMYTTRDLYGGSNYTSICSIVGNNTSGDRSFAYWFTVETLGDMYYKLTPTQTFLDRCVTLGVDDIGYYYFRLSVPGVGATLVITENEPIK